MNQGLNGGGVGVGYQDLSGSNTKKQLFESSLIDISYKNKSWEEK